MKKTCDLDVALAKIRNNLSTELECRIAKFILDQYPVSRLELARVVMIAWLFRSLNPQCLTNSAPWLRTALETRLRVLSINGGMSRPLLGGNPVRALLAKIDAALCSYVAGMENTEQGKRAEDSACKRDIPKAYWWEYPSLAAQRFRMSQAREW